MIEKREAMILVNIIFEKSDKADEEGITRLSAMATEGHAHPMIDFVIEETRKENLDAIELNVNRGNADKTESSRL